MWTIIIIGAFLIGAAVTFVWWGSSDNLIGCLVHTVSIALFIIFTFWLAFLLD